MEALLKLRAANLLIGIFFGLVACDKSKLPKQNPPSSRSAPDPQHISPIPQEKKQNIIMAFRESEDPDESLDALIAKTLDELGKDRCANSQGSQSEECRNELVSIDFRSGAFRNQSGSDEAILIAENEMCKLTPLTRYRGRIKEFYEIEDGQLKKANPIITLPSGLARILFRFDRNPFVSAKELELILSGMSPNFLSYDEFGHSKGVTETVIEYSPQAPIVLLDNISDLDKLFGADMCHLADDKNVKTALLGKSQALARQISEIIISNNIRYINLSFGFTDDGLFSEVERICEQSDPRLVDGLVEVLRPIMEALQRPDKHLFVTAQSAPYHEPGPFDQVKGERLFFLTGLFNRNVKQVGADGFIDVGRFELGPSLSENLHHLAIQLKAVGTDANVFINWHSEYRRIPHPNRPNITSSFGFGWNNNFSVPSTSFTSPIFIGWLNKLRMQKMSESFDQSIHNIIDEILPAHCPFLPGNRCVFQDPLLYHLK